jgi:ABC-type spermidine/putrescine transport system permease subunit I
MPRLGPQAISLALLVPILLLLIFFFLIPLAYLLRLSALAQQPTLQNPFPELSVVNYVKILQDYFYLSMSLNSVLVGLGTTFFTVAIA